MKIGDTVVFAADPLLYGHGVYVDTTAAGLMVVEFADGSRELFRALELDTPERAYLSAP